MKGIHKIRKHNDISKRHDVPLTAVFIVDRKTETFFLHNKGTDPQTGDILFDLFDTEDGACIMHPEMAKRLIDVLKREDLTTINFHEVMRRNDSIIKLKP